MNIVADIFVALVALLHAYFLVVEMFLWRTPRVRAAFGTTPEFAEASSTLAANQGLYNGFLAAGLIWALIAGDSIGYSMKIFFLSCVIIAGLYGAATANRRILFIQAAPAALALAFVLIAGR
jgi:putative membrane protein